MTELKRIRENILIKQFITGMLQKEYFSLIKEIVSDIYSKKLTYLESLKQIKNYIGIYSELHWYIKI